MLDALSSYLDNRSSGELARDFIDIVVVYYVFYRLLLVARGTRAMQVAAGLGIVSLLYVVAQTVGLVTIVTLVGSLLQSIILVIVVVFQNDIRRALQRVGSRAIFGNLGRAQESAVIDQVVQAAGELARHRIGAIITFEQDANLDEFIGQNKGIELDAKVSTELLVSLFIPEGSNKLHDGAVIIRNLRIAKAGVFYPMPENRTFDPTFGSRHRAALGITEETDAVVVVVSEERGNISFCFNGNIASNLEAEQLKEMLSSIMNPKLRKKARKLSQKRRPSLVPRASESRREEDSPPSSLRRTPGSTPPPPLRKAPSTARPDKALQELALGQKPRLQKASPQQHTRSPEPYDATPPAGVASEQSERAGENSTPTPVASHYDQPRETPAGEKRRTQPSLMVARPSEPPPTPTSGRMAPTHQTRSPSPANLEASPDSSKEDSDDDSLHLRVSRSPRPMPRGKELELGPDSEDPEESSKPL